MLYSKIFFNHFRGWGWLVANVTLLPESTTENLRTGATEVTGESVRDGLFFYGLVIQRFPESQMKNF